MMRLLTVFWLVLAIALGTGVFVLKYEVQAREAELAALDDALGASRRQVHMLQAEWAHLTAPDRLHRLADRFLTLTPVQPAQVTTLAAVPRPGDSGPRGLPVPRVKPAPGHRAAARRKPVELAESGGGR